jgi:hypothetical protein
MTNQSNITPIFVFSLPRSGSTLVQRILALHPDVSTVSEPWILLPYLYTLKKSGVYAEYAHFGVVRAIEDFCQVLRNGKNDYLAEIRELTLRLYAKASKSNAQYFVDKTPRYHLIVEDVIELFPEGKPIFLWRNPLAVVASIIETWGKGRWNIYRYKVDLFTGLENLLATYEARRDSLYSVKYETLVINLEAECQRLFDYLGLRFDPDWLENLADIKLRGSMGDPVGTSGYETVSREPLEKWRFTLSNPVRKAWCRSYLRWIGAQRLSLMGYDQDLLLDELKAAPTGLHHVASDILNLVGSVIMYVVEPHILKHKVRDAKGWQDIHLHL